MEQIVIPCPFCGSHNIGYSVKTTGRWERKYHVAMYCKDCNCYGKRILITPTETSRYDVERNIEYKQLAIDAWNTREPMERILMRLGEKMEQHHKLSLDEQLERSEQIIQNRQSNCFFNARKIVKEEGGFSA